MAGWLVVHQRGKEKEQEDLRWRLRDLEEHPLDPGWERGKNEAIKLLNLKRKKGRYNIEVSDENLREDFHNFMVNIISSFDEEVVCRELKRLKPDASCD